jgi:hypothetical protein
MLAPFFKVEVHEVTKADGGGGKRGKAPGIFTVDSR